MQQSAGQSKPGRVKNNDVWLGRGRGATLTGRGVEEENFDADLILIRSVTVQTPGGFFIKGM